MHCSAISSIKVNCIAIFFSLLYLVFCAPKIQAQTIEDSLYHLTTQLKNLQAEKEFLEHDLAEMKLRKIVKDLKNIGPPSQDFIEHSAMLLEYDQNCHLPKWVMHIIMPDIAYGNVGRTDNFREDPKVPGGTAVDVDFYNPELEAYYADDAHEGMDRGHLAPSNDFRWNKKALDESYMFSNIAPQYASFNRKKWAELEMFLRNYVLEHKTKLFVLTIPYVEEEHEIIPYSINEVCIPSAFIKIAFDVKNEKGIAFYLPHAPTQEALESYVHSIDEMESLLGIDVAHALDIELQEKIESQTKFTDWLSSTSNRMEVLELDAETLPANHFNTKQAQIYKGQHQEVSICGTVVSYKKSRSGNFWINVDKPFPHQVYSIMVRKTLVENLDIKELEAYFGQRICCTGKVANMNGTATTIVEDLDQITTLE